MQDACEASACMRRQHRSYASSASQCSSKDKSGLLEHKTAHVPTATAYDNTAEYFHTKSHTWPIRSCMLTNCMPRIHGHRINASSQSVWCGCLHVLYLATRLSKSVATEKWGQRQSNLRRHGGDTYEDCYLAGHCDQMLAQCGSSDWVRISHLWFLAAHYDSRQALRDDVICQLVRFSRRLTIWRNVVKLAKLVPDVLGWGSIVNVEQAYWIS